jgi:hypothetical protein
MSDTAVTIVAGSIGAVVGACLGYFGSYVLYRKKRSDDAEKYRQQKEDADESYRREQMDTELSVRVTRVVLQHDLCAAAKDWLRKLPNWGDDLRDKERTDNIRYEAVDRMNACYQAWDQALNGIDQADVLVVMEALKGKTDDALTRVQSGETLTPDVGELQQALRNFRETVNRELSTRL